MSVMEFSSAVASAVFDRRNRTRLRMKNLLRVHIGRGTGEVQDISAGGIRLRHTGMLTRGSQVRVAFDWRRAHFAGTAEVLASRVVGLGKGEQNGTVYDTRFRFVLLTPDAQDILTAILAAESANCHSDTRDSMIQ